MATAPLGTLLRHIHQLAGEPPGSTRRFADRQLLDDFAARRDETAFATLVARHGPMVLRVCRRVLGHEQDAEDAFQATFLVLAHKLGSIRQRETVGNWLHGVAYRTAMKAKRSAARRRNHEKRAATPETTSSPTWDEVQGVLDEEIQRLPDPLRAAFVLRVLEDKSGPEAAVELSCREGTVASRLLRARRRLQDRLARRGIQLSALLAALALTQTAKATVPAGLSRLVVQSGLLTAAGESAAALVPAHVAALASGVTRAMFLTKAKIAGVVLLAIALTAGGLVHALASGEDAKPQQQAASAKQQTGKDEGIRLSGRVLGPDGKPVPKAGLYWWRFRKYPPETERDLTWERQAVSDADGRFQFTLKTQAEVERPLPLIAAADGFGVGWTELPAKGKQNELTLRLVKDAPVKGRVLDTQGKPVAGARVYATGVVASGKDKLDAFLSLWKRDWRENWRLSDQTLYARLDAFQPTIPTDKDGRFTMSGIGLERVATVEVEGPNISKSTLYVVTRPDFDPKPYNDAAAANTPGPPRIGQTPLLYGPAFDYVATPTRIIEGAIREVDTGTPIGGAHVMAGAGHNSSVFTVSDAQGRYKLAGLPKMDEYLVSVGAPKDTNILSRTIAVTGPEGLGPITQDIELAHGVVVTGRIIDKSNGKGVQGGVRFAPLPENTFFGKKPGYDGYSRDRTMISSDAEGNYRIVVIPGPGVLMAQVWSRAEKLDGQPLNPFRAAEFDAEDAKRAKPVNNGGDRLFTAAGNSVEFLGLEGVVKVLDFAEGTEKATVNLSVDRGKTLAVRIEDPEGKPLPGAIVSGMTDLWPATFTLKKAECTIYALEGTRQRHVVFYHRERKLSGHVIVRGDEKEAVTVRLEPVGAVTGRLLDTDGQPISGVEVSLSMSLNVGRELFRYLDAQREPVKSDKDGRFRLDGIMPKLMFQLGLRQGRTYYVGEPKIGDRNVGAGKTLDLGDVHVKPAR
jgi:RNA polymerase sigma factor (sigma-70 family)